MENNDSEIVELSLKTGRWSNTIDHELLFSIVNNRFVKGTPHKGLNWEINYKIYSGNYIIFKVHGFTNNRGVDLEISKIRVDKSGYETIEKYFDKKVVLEDIQNYIGKDNSSKIVKDFISSLPFGYHSIGSIPVSDKYSEKIEDAILFLDKYIKNSTEM